VNIRNVKNFYSCNGQVGRKVTDFEMDFGNREIPGRLDCTQRIRDIEDQLENIKRTHSCRNGYNEDLRLDSEFYDLV
jgi:nucleoid-associated protein YejK